MRQMNSQYLSELEAIMLYVRNKYPYRQYDGSPLSKQRSNELYAIEKLIGRCNTYPNEDPIDITWDLIFSTHLMFKKCKKENRIMFYDQLHVYIDIYKLLKEVNGL